MHEALLDTWRIHNRINLYLLDGLAEHSLKDISSSKGRNVVSKSHHRGQIVLALKQSGHPVDKKTAFGLWEWGVR